MGKTKLSEIAKKYDLDVKKLEKSALKHNMNLSDGKDSIIKKGDELKLLKDAGVTFKSEINIDAVNKTEKAASAPLLFLEDIKSETSPVYRTDLSHELFLHNDILDNLTAVNNITEPVKKRFNLVLRQLASHGKPSSIIKGTSQGWRRTPLGDKYKYYLWWAPKGAPPVKDLKSSDGSIFIRQIREHGNHETLNCDNLKEDYEPLTIKKLVEEKEIFLEPWTAGQKEFVANTKAVRILNGSPGSGKTTALWNAINIRSNEKVLYISRSIKLVELAKEHFEAFSQADTSVECTTFSSLLNQILSMPDSNLALASEESFKLFEKAVWAVPDNILGKWKDQIYSLWSVIRAYLIGFANPDEPRELESLRPRLNDNKFQKMRSKMPGIGEAEIQSILDIVRYLERKDHVESFFSDLVRAFTAARSLMEKVTLPESLNKINRIVVDEVQDFTSLEAIVPIFLARRIAKKNIKRLVPFLLLAGDPSQTVVPTGFQWPHFKNLISKYLQDPEEIKLESNLRSPYNISNLVNKTGDLYSNIPKENRPKGAILNTDLNESTNDQIYYCRIENRDEIESLIFSLAEEPDLAIIYLENNPPPYIPKTSLEAIQTPEMVKGRDIQKVCILDASKYLLEIKKEYEFYKNEKDDPIWKRTFIDRFRVSISRSTEVLIFLDIDYGEETLTEIENFLKDTLYIPVDANNILSFLQELDPETIVRECIKDAVDSMEMAPMLAWRRARQAVGRLGDPDKPNSVVDEVLRAEAYLTCARTALFILDSKKSNSENIDVLHIGQESAGNAGRDDIVKLYKSIIALYEDNLNMLKISELCNSLNSMIKKDTWIEVYITSKHAAVWKNKLDLQLFNLTEDEIDIFSRKIPEFYKTFFIKNYISESQKTITSLSEHFIKNKEFNKALLALKTLPISQDLLLAKCYEGLKDFNEAANYYEKAKEWNLAINCFRQDAQIEGAIRCLKHLPKHPDAATLIWIKELWIVLNKRPGASKLTIEERKKITELIAGL